MDISKYVGVRIRDLRKNYGEKGLSQEELAEALDVASNTISRWETATYQPRLEDLDKLARFFGISILEFFPPEDTVTSSDQITALLRTAKQLAPEDLEEIQRYAEFRHARRLYGEKKQPGRKRKNG